MEQTNAQIDEREKRDNEFKNVVTKYLVKSIKNQKTILYTILFIGILSSALIIADIIIQYQMNMGKVQHSIIEDPIQNNNEDIQQAYEQYLADFKDEDIKKISFQDYEQISKFMRIYDSFEDEDTYEDFNLEFYKDAFDQMLYAQDLLLNKEILESNRDSIFIQFFELKLKIYKDSKPPKECRKIKDKRSYNLELGELSIKIKNGDIANVKGFDIKRESVDRILAQVFIYDNALSKICIVLKKLPAPTTKEEREFILDLMDKQQAVVDSYTKLQIALSYCTNENQVEENLEQLKNNAEEVKKTFDAE